MQVERFTSVKLGKRESNTLVICPRDEDNPEKFGIILDNSGRTKVIST